MLLRMVLFYAVVSCYAWVGLFRGIRFRRELRRRMENERTRTTGTIVEYVSAAHRNKTNGSYRYWKPVIAYTADGKEYREECQSGLSRENFPAGTQIDILYDNNDPTHFHPDADPSFAAQGRGAIGKSIAWIIASAVLTLLLTMFFGGPHGNGVISPNYLWYRIRTGRWISPKELWFFFRQALRQP